MLANFPVSLKHRNIKINAGDLIIVNEIDFCVYVCVWLVEGVTSL